MKLVAFLKLIRWKNLLLIVYTLLLIKFFLFKAYNINSLLSNTQFIVLTLAIVLITAAGYIINDIFDIEVDKINKPHKIIVSKNFSIESANRIYLLANSIGLILGIWLALNIEQPSYSLLFIGASLLLYYYSKYFKGKPFIGNVIVSFLTAFSIFILVFFELGFDINSKNKLSVFTIITLLTIIAFLLNLVRELVKDIIDVNGDYKLKMKTLPILIGRKRTINIVVTLCLFLLGFLFYLVFNFAEDYKFTVLYLVVTSVVPLIYITSQLYRDSSNKKLVKISSYLKIVMFLGINVLIVLSLNPQ